jgi:hypothetical protein
MKSVYTITAIFALTVVASAQFDHDVGVSAILSPPETTNIFLYHPIEIEITNYGQSEESFDVIFDVYIVDSTVISFSDTLSVVNLAPGVIDTVTSSRTFSIIRMIHEPPWTQFYEYDMFAYSSLGGDENPQNDSVYQRMVFITESFVIVGDKLANPINVNIGSIIEIPVWGGTPAGNNIDSVAYIHIPMASNDTVITERYPCIYFDPQNVLPAHSYFPDTLIGLWDDRFFWPPDHNHPQPYWTNQSIEAYCVYLDPNKLLHTSGDTVIIGTYVMSTAFNPGLMGEVIWPFIESDHPVLRDLHFGLQNGTTPVFANSSYGPIRFMTPDELGYVVGTVTDTSGSPADGAVVSLIDAFREDTTDLSGGYYLQWITPGIYSMEFYHPDHGTAFLNDIEILAGDTADVDFQFGAGGCEYLPGDANGNDNTNGLDVVYLVAYFKGGSAPPDQCDCPPHGIIYPAADANGSCATNGLDVTYMVSYFKGGSPIAYCADCPPQE